MEEEKKDIVGNGGGKMNGKMKITIKERNFFLFLIGILNAVSLYSQVLKGTIVDEENKNVEYVNVGIVGTRKGVISNEKGNFSINISEQKQTDSLYFHHLSYKRKSIAIKDFSNNNVIILEQNYIEIPPVEVSVKMPKLKTIKGKGTRFAGAVASFTSKDIEVNTFSESVGDIITLKNEYIAKEFHMNCIKNTFEKAIFRLNFYKMEENSFIPLSEVPLYIQIAKNDKKNTITETINVSLPKGKIWIELVLVDLEGDDKSEIIFPVSFSGGWTRIGEELEKLPLGIGLSFAIKGYKIE